MQIIDTFSGIGGFSLAGRWMGWRTIQFCEINKFCQRVLSYYWPEVPIHDDMKTLSASQIKNNGLYDPTESTILVGGVPCQPWSSAGKRLGEKDNRNLWPETIKLIGEFRPDFAVLENVRGFTNWNGGMVFDQVQADLEAEGYEVLPFLLPACAVNAPHRRDRIWIVAHATRDGHGYQLGKSGREKKGQQGAQQRQERDQEERQRDGCNAERIALERTTPDTGGTGFQKPTRREQRSPSKTSGTFKGCEFGGAFTTPTGWQDFPTQPPVCGRTHGISSFLARNIKQEVYATISERYTDKDLQEVREAIQSEKILREIGGLYKIHEPGILLEVLQLCSPSITEPQGVSVWSEKASEGLMRKVREYGTFANTPQGRELEKQFRKQFADSLPILSHEIALVAMEAERAAQKFASWHKKESIMAYGNAIVPQIAYEIFKVIGQIYDNK